MFYVLFFVTASYMVQMPGQFDNVASCQTAAKQIVSVLPKKHKPSYLCLSVAVQSEDKK